MLSSRANYRRDDVRGMLNQQRLIRTTLLKRPAVAKQRIDSSKGGAGICNSVRHLLLHPTHPFLAQVVL